MITYQNELKTLTTKKIRENNLLNCGTMTFGSIDSCQLQLTRCWQLIVKRMIKYLNNILKLKFVNCVFELNDDLNVDDLIDEWVINLDELDDFKLGDDKEYENVCLFNNDLNELIHDLNDLNVLLNILLNELFNESIELFSFDNLDDLYRSRSSIWLECSINISFIFFLKFKK